MYEAHRYHDFCAGHRVVGHEHKCRHLHGHNYRVHFYCTAQALDNVGRVIDFSVIDQLLCQWLENHWDHRLLLWEQDELLSALQAIDNKVIAVPFNPTAENMAAFLAQEIAPKQLLGTGVIVQKVIVEETRKCSAIFTV